MEENNLGQENIKGDNSYNQLRHYYRWSK